LTIAPFAEWQNYQASLERTAHYYTTDDGLGRRALQDCPNHVNPYIWPTPSKKTAKNVPAWIAAAIAKGILKKK
jgi:hypothetical protein